MAVFRALLIILEAGCSLALIGLILLQKSKEGGLGLSFGSGGGDSLFGARTGNVLSKATVGIGILFLANTLLLGILFAGSSGGASLIEKELSSKPAPIQQSSAAQIPEGVPVSE